MPLQDLVFAYRERYRRVTPSRIEQCVRRDPTFVLTARDTIGLRCWFVVEIQAAAELADRTAKQRLVVGEPEVHGWPRVPQSSARVVRTSATDATR